MLFSACFSTAPRLTNMLTSMSMNLLMVATSSYLTTEMLFVLLSSHSGCLANITGQLTRQHPLQLAPSRGSWRATLWGGDRLQASSLCLGRGKVLLREELLWRLMMPPQVQCRFVQGIHILSKLARTATVVNKLQDVFGTVFTNTELSEL